MLWLVVTLGLMDLKRYIVRTITTSSNLNGARVQGQSKDWAIFLKKNKGSPLTERYL